MKKIKPMMVKDEKADCWGEKSGDMKFIVRPFQFSYKSPLSETLSESEFSPFPQDQISLLFSARPSVQLRN